MTNIYNVEIQHQGKTYKIQVAEDQNILEAALAAGVELPSSCTAGVCTTCAALLTEGKLEQGDAMGVSKELQQEGYALLCVAYPRSDLKLESEKEDAIYQRQFGQP
jgi:ferredoxin